MTKASSIASLARPETLFDVLLACTL